MAAVKIKAICALNSSSPSLGMRNGIRQRRRHGWIDFSEVSQGPAAPRGALALCSTAAAAAA